MNKNTMPKKYICNDKEINFETTRIMGILNVTPDSFSDGGKYSDSRAIADQIDIFLKNNVAVIDVGGESTRPGSQYVDTKTELERVIPAIKLIRQKSSDIIISIDTNKAETADKAILAGADIINDISALENDPQMINILKKYPKSGIILMHKQGNPEDMQNNPHYENPVEEIIDYLRRRIEFCRKNGVDKARIIIDPGIGFGKKLEHNLKLIKYLDKLKSLGTPVLLGASRKSFINAVQHSEPAERLGGTLASTAFALQTKTEIVRVHDVLANNMFINVYNAIRKA